MTDERKLIDLQLENQNEAMTLLGTGDSHLKVLEEELGIAIITRGETITIEGKVPEAELAFDVIRALLSVIRNGITISTRDVIYAVSLAKKGSLDYFQEMYEEEIGKTVKGKPIRIKTLGQKQYISAIRRNDIVFGIGPAGTGKTFLAVVMAVAALKSTFDVIIFPNIYIRSPSADIRTERESKNVPSILSNPNEKIPITVNGSIATRRIRP